LDFFISNRGFLVVDFGARRNAKRGKDFWQLSVFIIAALQAAWPQNDLTQP
jgi:hypothetical protein